MPPIAYGARPYVRSGRLADLVREQGRNASEAEWRKGQLQAQMWGNLGNQVSGTLRDLVQYQADAPRRAQEAEAGQLRIDAARGEQDQAQQAKRQDAAFLGLFEKYPDGLPPPREVIAIYGPQRGTQVLQGLAAFHELTTKSTTDARDTAGRLATGLKALSPEVQAQMWPAVRQAAIAGGFATEDQIPAEAQPEYLEAVIGWATGKGPEKAPAPEPFTLGPGQQRFGPDGQPIASVAPNTPEPKTHTITVKGPNGKPVKKLVTEDELKAGVEEYREPPSTGGSEVGWDTLTVTDPNTNETKLIRVNKRTGEVQPVTLPGGLQPGGQRAPRLTAGQQDDLATMDTVVDLANLAQTLGDKIGWKGVGGMGSGSASSLMARSLGAGTEDEEKLRNYVGNIQGTIAKLRGGTAFSAAEKKMLDSYTPTINDSDKVIQTKLKSMKEFIDLKRKNTLKYAGSTSEPKAADPLGILD